jgi:predicted transglutaminase-like cysteine proteinase
MRVDAKYILNRGAAAMAVGLALLGGVTVSTARSLPPFAALGTEPSHPLLMSIGAPTAPPDGWIYFCLEYAADCKTTPSTTRHVVLTEERWAELARVNLWVNRHIRPMSDLKHWGTLERWNYPDDGYGDCEDYALLKRRMLIETGWPREALLMTVVDDLQGEGHAVLTVETDKGELILDNQTDSILPWSDTGYDYLSRQSQSDPNAWVSIVQPPAGPAIAALVAPQPVAPRELDNVLAVSGDAVGQNQDSIKIALDDKNSTPGGSGPSRRSAQESGWAVQLIGNTSEDSALTSYRRMQQTYNNLLGSRQPLVIRSSVGLNADWYRVRIAMNNRGDAQSLCDGLRAAGGSCLVQRD